ncbi:BZ3500_MvSof-1268-A1-R1_C113g00619 [Microbotryum saponariae]|uniref:BZ3500_MvSof-1268-A1-R1_C113g00619 protein n=1 Tax=Microbotryum saponariae TaxID=289078 RepID=A0A2X0KNU5_9BASI|nr:BZ3500_MvSof-1268-A1-R1_C113g00619 [Microbotryum saponariae]
MESEAAAKTEVIKIESEDESVLEDCSGSDGKVIDENEVMRMERGETEGEVLRRWRKRRWATEVGDVDEARGSTKAENAEATDLGERTGWTMTTTATPHNRPPPLPANRRRHEPTPPLSPETLAKSATRGEEWDRIRANWVSRHDLTDQSIERRLNAETPLVRHNFATWDETVRYAPSTSGDRCEVQEAGDEESQTAADLSDPSDEPTDAKRVIIKGKSRVVVKDE